MKNKILIIFIILITLIIIFMSGYYFYYKKVNVKEPKQNFEQAKQQLQIEDYINYELSNKYIACQSEPVTETIIIPKIVYDSTEVEKINNQIKTDFKTYIDYANNSDEVNLNNSDAYNVSYEYFDDEEYLSVIISYSSGMYCSTINSSKAYYIYDKTQDLYLSKDDLLKKFNITNDDIKTQIDLLSSSDDVKNNLKKIVDDNRYGYYVENNRLLIYISNNADINEILMFDK